MSPADLKYEHESRHPNSHFFDRKTMQFFGDTMRNYGISKTVLQTADAATGLIVPVAVWELFRRKPVKAGVQSSAFFARDDFRRVHPIQWEK